MSELDMTQDLEPEEPVREEEFEGTDPGADSTDTGTHYAATGEADATPHDQELDSEDEE